MMRQGAPETMTKTLKNAFQTAPPEQAPLPREAPDRPSVAPRDAGATGTPDVVELASMLSFPASDAPAWIARRPKKS
jgi:hypothetical protein